MQRDGLEHASERASEPAAVLPEARSPLSGVDIGTPNCRSDRSWPLPPTLLSGQRTRPLLLPNPRVPQQAPSRSSLILSLSFLRLLSFPPSNQVDMVKSFPSIKSEHTALVVHWTASGINYSNVFNFILGFLAHAHAATHGDCAVRRLFFLHPVQMDRRLWVSQSQQTT